MAKETVSINLPDGKVITLESGRLAKQAGGSVVVRMGDTVVLCTVCAGPEGVKNDFFPLTVEYREKYYAAGKIPGGYIKREAKPSDKEVLTCRIIDRPLRPMFPEGYSREVQIVCTVLSVDDKYDSDTLSLIGSSAAIGLSHLPFEDQVAAVKVMGKGGKYTVNPTYEELESAEIEMIVAGTESSIVMVEGAAFEVPEEVMVNAILAGHEAIKVIVKGQQALISRFPSEKDVFTQPEVDKALFAKVEAFAKPLLNKTFHTPMLKKAHYAAMKKIKADAVEALKGEFPERKDDIKAYVEAIQWSDMREMVLSEKLRIDGRGPADIRDISIETSALPRTHGSAVFQRGETQALVVCTLGTKQDEQRVDSLQGETFKNYMLHYNFPGFSVGEAKRMNSVGRREVGHGFLAERALAPVLPTSESFPYTIRLVSDILESHGSSSMASVCGGTLALMDAGVKIKSPVAGIAMGMVSDGTRFETLSDINGTEDHLGDMDFKVCGTEKGLTSFQMDIKLRGLTTELMQRALAQAKAGRLHILGKMKEALPAARELNKLAPSIVQRQIPVDKIKDLIGPGGKVIRGIQESSGATLNVDDTGKLTISAAHRGNAIMAMKMVNELFAEAEVGKIYKGKVKGIATFGAFVEILPGKEGLVHISELAPQKVDRVEDVLSMGDEVEVKCIGVDPQGKIKLSRKVLLLQGA